MLMSRSGTILTQLLSLLFVTILGMYECSRSSTRRSIHNEGRYPLPKTTNSPAFLLSPAGAQVRQAWMASEGNSPSAFPLRLLTQITDCRSSKRGAHSACRELSDRCPARGTIRLDTRSDGDQQRHFLIPDLPSDIQAKLAADGNEGSDGHAKDDRRSWSLF